MEVIIEEKKRDHEPMANFQLCNPKTKNGWSSS